MQATITMSLGPKSFSEHAYPEIVSQAVQGKHLIGCLTSTCSTDPSGVHSIEVNRQIETFDDDFSAAQV